MDIKVFISYRRTDSKTFAGRIYDRMAERFGKDNVFKDVDDIPAGYDFREVLNESVNNCNVLIVLIGSEWLEQDGVRRLDDPTDFVRIEIEAGLRHKDTLVIPVLISDTHMPSPDKLPDTLESLAFRNAAIVRDDPDFHNDINKLIRQIAQHFGIEAFPELQKPDLVKPSPVEVEKPTVDKKPTPIETEIPQSQFENEAQHQLMQISSYWSILKSRSAIVIALTYLLSILVIPALLYQSGYRNMVILDINVRSIGYTLPVSLAISISIIWALSRNGFNLMWLGKIGVIISWCIAIIATGIAFQENDWIFNSDYISSASSQVLSALLWFLFSAIGIGGTWFFLRREHQFINMKDATKMVIGWWLAMILPLVILSFISSTTIFIEFPNYVWIAGHDILSHIRMISDGSDLIVPLLREWVTLLISMWLAGATLLYLLQVARYKHETK